MDELDLIDRKIVAELMRDATISVAQIAERVGLSQTPCWKRIQKLQDSGVLIGRVALAATLGGAQVVLHTLLSAGHHAPTCAVGGGHHEMVVGCAGGAEVSHTSPAMVLAHTVAALLLALLLARGEEAVWFLAGLLRPVLPRPIRRVVDAAPSEIPRSRSSTIPSSALAKSDRTWPLTLSLCPGWPMPILRRR